MVYQYDACDQISDFCRQQLLREMRRQISWTDGKTDRRTEVTQYTPLPLRGAGVYLDMYCIVCFTIHPYIMASCFRLCRDSYFQAINHQWVSLLKLNTRQDMLIDWSLTFNVISFSAIWWSISSTYQSPVSLLCKIGYTPRDCVRLVNILNCFA